MQAYGASTPECRASATLSITARQGIVTFPTTGSGPTFGQTGWGQVRHSDKCDFKGRARVLMSDLTPVDGPVDAGDWLVSRGLRPRERCLSPTCCGRSPHPRLTIDAVPEAGSGPTFGQKWLPRPGSCPNVGPDPRKKTGASPGFHQASLPWQALYFLPLPQGQGSLRPTLTPALMPTSGMLAGVAIGASSSSGAAFGLKSACW